MDDQLLSNLYFIEYFKFINEDVYVFLTNRTLILTDSKDVIAVRNENMFFSSQSFMEQFK